MPPFSTEMQRDLRDLARKFAKKEIQPVIEKDEHDETFRPEMIRKMGELGLTGVPTPTAYQGAGLGALEFAAVIEEIAAISTSYAVSIAVSALPQVILAKFGTEEQKQKYIPDLAQGKAVGAFSLSEPEAGSDAGSLLTTAKKEGAHYVLMGTKQWATQGDSAQTLIVMARTGGPGPKGISSFILEKGMPGLKMGKREKKLGMHVSHTMELVLDGVQIPASNRIGQDGDGFKIALAALDSGRINIGACALGVARSALEIATHHACQRKQFGKAIADFQGVSFMLADMATELEAAKLLVEQAAYLKDHGRDFTTQAAMAKLFATDMAMKVTTDAIQILGGSGTTQEFPLERFMREAKILQIVEGTNQIQRLVIGRALAAQKEM